MIEKFDCANPKCQNKGFVLFGRKWFCGECLIKVKQIMSEKDEEYLLNRLQDVD